MEGDEWTRLEREVWKDGVAALALAVVRQWRTDGSPECDRGCVELWELLLKEHLNHKEVKR